MACLTNRPVLSILLDLAATHVDQESQRRHIDVFVRKVLEGISDLLERDEIGSPKNAIAQRAALGVGQPDSAASIHRHAYTTALGNTTRK